MTYVITYELHTVPQCEQLLNAPFYPWRYLGGKPSWGIRVDDISVPDLGAPVLVFRGQF